MALHKIPFTNDQVSTKGASILLGTGAVVGRYGPRLVIKLAGLIAGLVSSVRGEKPEERKVG